MKHDRGNLAVPTRRNGLKRGFALLAGAVLGAVAAAAAGPASATADTWPSKPVRVVVPFSSGGTADLTARIIAQQLGKQLGVGFVVDNKPGAGATIGTAEVARAPADGYTVAVVTITFTITQHVYSSLPYDGQKDFVPVGLLMTTPLILVVNPGLNMKTPQDFIAAAKAKPGQVSFSSSGSGSAPHLGFEVLKQTAGIDLLHVPYKGGGEAITAVMAGNTNAYFAAPIEVTELVKAGKLTALGSTAPRRTPALAHLPTIAESGVPGFELIHYTAMLIKAGTPPDIVAKLSENLVKALQAPEVREKISQNGDVPAGTMAEAADLFKRSYDQIGRVVKAANIKAD
jgi:tripartite-type tricarboxylate transporter receptor subunit TctC